MKPEDVKLKLQAIADAHEKRLGLILDGKNRVSPNATALRLQTLTETTLKKLRALGESLEVRGK